MITKKVEEDRKEKKNSKRKTAEVQKLHTLDLKILAN